MVKFDFSKMNELAVCTKDLQGKVVSQNPLSIQVCGNCVGTNCDSGCVDFRPCQDSLASPDERLSTVNRCEVHGSLFDVLYIRGAEDHTTVLFPREEKTASVEEVDPNHLLTPREKEILAMIQKGHTNSEIQSKLGISKPTLKTHINHVYTKLGIAPSWGRKGMRTSRFK